MLRRERKRRRARALTCALARADILIDGKGL
jgi:hypothetical protein